MCVPITQFAASKVTTFAIVFFGIFWHFLLPSEALKRVIEKMPKGFDEFFLSSQTFYAKTVFAASQSQRVFSKNFVSRILKMDILKMSKNPK
jgi:hypothetical protein